MDRTEVKAIRRKLDTVLSEAFPEYKTKSGDITYDKDGWCKVPITFSKIVDGKEMTKEYTDLLQVAEQCKVNPNQKYGHPKYGTVTLIGYRSRASKYPFVMQAEDGKKYGVTMRDAQRYFE